MYWKIFGILFLVLVLAGCQKATFPLGMVDEPEGGPEYTVEPDLNGPATKAE